MTVSSIREKKIDTHPLKTRRARGSLDAISKLRNCKEEFSTWAEMDEEYKTP